MWRKELGKANSKHIKLEKKFGLLHTLSSSFTSDHHSEEYLANSRQYEMCSEIDMQNMGVTNCSICASEITDYVREYFCGEVVNPVCDACKYDANLSERNQTFDPFSSFPVSGMPISLASHWTPPLMMSRQSLDSIPSLRAHYVLIQNPGKRFISMDEVLRELKDFTEEQCRKLDAQCQKLESSCSQS